MTTNLLIKSLRQVCSQPEKLFYGDYLFVYASDENNVVVLIQPTPESADTPEADIPDEEVVHTMGDDMLETMKLKMVRYVMTLILAVGRSMKLMMTLNLCMIPLKRISDINYIWISETTNGKKYCGG